jgi:hypothetical protein
MASVFPSYDADKAGRSPPCSPSPELRDSELPLIMKTAGLLDYWQKSGQWPDSCFETDMPYDCKKEAAKLKV